MGRILRDTETKCHSPHFVPSTQNIRLHGIAKPAHVATKIVRDILARLVQDSAVLVCGVGDISVTCDCTRYSQVRESAAAAAAAGLQNLTSIARIRTAAIGVLCHSPGRTNNYVYRCIGLFTLYITRGRVHTHTHTHPHKLYM